MITTTAALALFAAGTTTAAAETQADEVPGPAAAELQRLLREHPEARQTAPNQITSPQGVTVTVADEHACDPGNFCLSQHQNYKGTYVDFWNCGDYQLTDWGMQDRVTSVRNNQTAGTYAWLGNYEDGHWITLYKSDAPDEVPHLGKDSDKGDAVHLC